MTILNVTPNDRDHTHEWPSGGHLYPSRIPNAKGYAYGFNSVFECSCGSRFVLQDSFIPGCYAWYPLRWYHRTAQKALKKKG